MKKFFLVIFAFIATFSLTAKEIEFSNKDCDVKIRYTNETYPGDAVFARLLLKSKKISTEDFSATMTLLSQENKQLDKAKFYVLKSDSKDSIELLCGVTLSSWQKKGAYNAKVVLISKTAEPLDFILPIQVLEKAFDKETLKLNASNTSIKTNTSSKRAEQVKKLSNLLMTTNKNSVYHTKKFELPLISKRRTAGYADRRVYEYSNGKSSTELHYGIDFGVPTGTDIFACASGKIVMAEERITTGWTVIIEHLPGLYSLYYHLNKLAVTENQMVKIGEKIGESGCTGLATGPHLHWQMSLNGQAVNPDFFLNDFSFEETTN